MVRDQRQRQQRSRQITSDTLFFSLKCLLAGLSSCTNVRQGSSTENHPRIRARASPYPDRLGRPRLYRVLESDFLGPRQVRPTLDNSTSADTETFRPTWVEPKTYENLSAHPQLASYLILLKSPEWNRTIAIYPVSTLSANNDLLVDPSVKPPSIVANVRRVTSADDCEVHVVCVMAEGRAAERQIVGLAVERARELVLGRRKDISESRLWNGLGVCTYESFHKTGQYLLLHPACATLTVM